jgi:trimethylamine--corrinoid protein Co-methyltransferase
MRTTIFAYGAPEVNIFNAALADMAHHYNLPFFCLAGATDSKVLDAQAGFEYAMSIYNATLNGCNIIHDCGYLESGLTSSFESLLMADEVISNITYTLQELRFNEQTVGLPVIQKGMKEGSFLTLDHTIKHYRNNLWFPRLMDRDNYDNWEKKGRKDLRQALASKAKEILDKHQIRKIPEQRERMIDEIVAKHQADVQA